MSDRWTTNGAFSRTTSSVPAARPIESAGLPPVSSASAAESRAESIPVTARVESWIKASPGTGLLIALAAGLAIGLWVKRS